MGEQATRMVQSSILSPYAKRTAQSLAYAHRLIR